MFAGKPAPQEALGRLQQEACLVEAGLPANAPGTSIIIGPSPKPMFLRIYPSSP